MADVAILEIRDRVFAGILRPIDGEHFRKRL